MRVCVCVDIKLNYSLCTAVCVREFTYFGCLVRPVIKRRGEEAVSRDWLSPVLVSARVRSGQVAF